jgi:hypothetical protein
VDLEIIILAQGTQQRLGRSVGWKQLLPLPACGGAPLLIRTLRQLEALNTGGMSITILTWNQLLEAVPPAWQPVVGRLGTRCEQLRNPGNSSLKGVARYLEEQPRDRGADGTVVLLGDVLYSWSCLSVLLVMAQTAAGFVGTSNLSGGGGELWGVAWHRKHEDTMVADLRDAMLRHPPFEDEYQPGQLRRWITGWRRGDLVEHVARLADRGGYRAIDDYTMDVDLPHHIPLLDTASVVAAADDLTHSLSWEAA